MRSLGSILLWAALVTAAAVNSADATTHAHKKSSAGSNKQSSKNSHSKKLQRRGSRRQKPMRPPPMPSRMEVQAVDPASGTVRVLLFGPMRPPEPRLFVLTDDRGRRFVPASANCHEQAVPDPAENALLRWQCQLTIAQSYRRAALTGVAMEWGERVVSVLPGQVRSRWAAAPTSPTDEPRPDRSEPPPENSTPSGQAAPQEGAAPSDEDPNEAGENEHERPEIER